jgi:hypothetical protein
MTTAKQKANTIKHLLRQRHGLTLTELAEQSAGAWTFRDVSDTVRGLRACQFGKCREIAEKIYALTGVDLTGNISMAA